MQTKFYLVGALEGQTVTLDRFQFVDGVYVFTGNQQDTILVANTLRSQYQAFPESEVEKAKQAYDEAQAELALDGPKETPASAEMSFKQRVSAQRFIDEGLDPEMVYGPGPTAETVKAHMQALQFEASPPGVINIPVIEAPVVIEDNGGDVQAPVQAKIETVADALQALDPANDEHWTARGVPSIEAMTKLLNKVVSRAEIEAVAPDYTRSIAKAAKAN